MAVRDSTEGFGAFFKRYARSWQHAVSTAALTAFGTLTVVDRLFAVLAVLAYVLPPVALYLRGSLGRGSESRNDASAADAVRGSDADSPRGAVESDDDIPDDALDVESDDSEPAAWTMATAPTDENLLDVAADGRDAYAVGSAGTVLADTGDGWTAVLTDGPGAGGNSLRGVAAVAGGGVWVAGDGGAVGRIDPETGAHVDHSAPGGDTTTLVDVAAAGTDGSETVLLVDGSGRVRRGRYRGDELLWDEPATPGSGSGFAGVTLRDADWGATCDTNQQVFGTDDGGRSFRRLGLDGVDGTLTDVDASDRDAWAVSDDDGVVHRFDGTRWTPVRLGDDPLSALALAGDRGLAAGADGAVYESPPGETGWERVLTPAERGLAGVAVGTTRAVAVGPEGTVVERAIDRVSD